MERAGGGAEPSRAQRRTVIWATYAIATLDITWMFLQFSVTPFLAKKLGFDTLWFGYLQTLVGVLQLIGNPLFGRFGDLFGAKAALTLSCGANVVFFLLLASAEHPVMLFIHKLPTLFMHVLPASQMVVTDLSEPDRRADALSKLGLCFGVGMLTGSTLGGHLNTLYGEKVTACVGAVGGAFSLLLVRMFIPKNTKAPTKAKTEGEKKSLFSLGEITRLLKYPGVVPTFIVKIVAGIPTGMFQSMFMIIALDVFKLDPKENGYLMAFFGISQMFIQGAVVGRLTARFKEPTLLLISIVASAAVGLGQAYMLHSGLLF
ncbi:solute carrier family 22 member 18 [Boleophthalmus pectinirostris]|uniref:solute carrier family 22 member 18 n=1 Tax=Boleophthalmus pectinirostris TaxID=150288 RepID=UPI0024330C9E|nr:solute carrier family 22 member 18 [Boleophthalmus pectinirostris]